MAHVRADYLGDWELKKLQKNMPEEKAETTYSFLWKMQKAERDGSPLLERFGIWRAPAQPHSGGGWSDLSHLCTFRAVVLLAWVQPCSKEGGEMLELCCFKHNFSFSHLPSEKGNSASCLPPVQFPQVVPGLAAPKDHTDGWCPHRPCYWVSPQQDSVHLLSPIWKQKYFHIFLNWKCIFMCRNIPAMEGWFWGGFSWCAFDQSWVEDCVVDHKYKWKGKRTRK